MSRIQATFPHTRTGDSASLSSIRTTQGGWMQPSRIHHVGLPVSDLDRSVAYREALGLTHESTAGVPGVSPSWSRRPASGSSCSEWMFSPLPGTPDRGAARRRPPHSLAVDDLDAAHARAVEAGGRSVWTPRDPVGSRRRSRGLSGPSSGRRSFLGAGNLYALKRHSGTLEQVTFWPCPVRCGTPCEAPQRTRERYRRSAHGSSSHCLGRRTSHRPRRSGSVVTTSDPAS